MSLKVRFILRFVLSDLRQSYSRFAFVLLSFAIGIAILVAVSGLSANLRTMIASEAKSLLAADIAISSSQPLEAEVEALIPADGRQAAEVTFASMMAVTPRSDDDSLSDLTARSRLVQVRALRGMYPFYGEAVVAPPAGLEMLRSGQDMTAALVDRVLAQQFSLSVGDTIELGKSRFTIQGIIKSFPGESYARTVIAPKVFIPYAALEGTALLQRGSRVSHKRYVAISSDVALQKTLASLKAAQPKARFEVETVESRRKNIERVLNNVSRFLSLVSLVAVLLGGIGVGGAMHTYVQSRHSISASLRCLGATKAQVLMLYIAQAVLVSLIGSAAGAIFGIALQHALPFIVGEFLPIQPTIAASFGVILQALVVGVGISLFLCVWPLLSLLNVSPLAAIRAEDSARVVSSGKANARSGFIIRIVLIASGIVLLCATAMLVLESIRFGLLAAFGLAKVGTTLASVSSCISWLLRRLRPTAGGFALRYGMASIHRPQNQTAVLMLTLGLSAFLLSTVYLSRTMILDQVSLSGAGLRPNLILFDVQQDQLEGVRNIAKTAGINVMDANPIVTMRLLSINNRKNLDLRADPEIPEWTLRREYRSSYRSQLVESESLISGELVSHFSGELSKSKVPVTVEEGIARDLKLKVGDVVSFDVQGVPVETVITGVRRVDWRRVQTNFFFLFPTGVLESAPQFFALMTRAESSESIALLQNQLLKQYGNVSAIDLNLILETADAVLSKIASAVKFLALFTVLSGLLVLVGTIATTRAARLRELLLLRTVGASRRQLVSSNLVEFAVIGLSAAIVGVGASMAASWGLSLYFFEAIFTLPALQLMAIVGGISGIVLIIGLASTVALLRSSVADVLRTGSA